MKKLVAIIICIMAVFVCGCSSVRINTQDKAVAKFVYGDKNIEMEFTDSDFQQIADIFNDKELYSDVPSCSFSDDISIMIDNHHYCIANDTCGIIYVKEKDKYFSLTDDENQSLRELLEGYGFTFPCL